MTSRAFDPKTDLTFWRWTKPARLPIKVLFRPQSPVQVGWKMPASLVDHPPEHSGRSKLINSPKHPLQMPIRASWLELQLHVPAQVRLRPHEPSLKVLHAHDALGII